MELIKDKVKTMRVCMQYLLDGIQAHKDRKGFKLNNSFYFRTIIGSHLEGDAGVCMLQLIFNKELNPEDFNGKNTAAHGANPVMMLAEVFKHSYDDLLRFLMCISIACKGDMTSLINYLYPDGFPVKKGADINFTKVKFPTFYLREYYSPRQLSYLEDYIKYLEAVEGKSK
jgi:hypothetical protein